MVNNRGFPDVKPEGGIEPLRSFLGIRRKFKWDMRETGTITKDLYPDSQENHGKGVAQNTVMPRCTVTQ